MTGRDPSAFEMYSMAVDMADRISARRGAANTYYVTLQSALLGVLGFLTRDSHPADRMVLSAICVAGAVTSATWFLQLRSYRDLNAAKFEVINKMERDLPYQVFADEWGVLKKDPVSKWKARYSELGTVERKVPIVFAAVNVVLGVYVWSL